MGITGDTSYAASAAAVQVSVAAAAAQRPAEAAGPTGLDKKVSGTITKPSQVDRTEFTAKAGDVVYLRAQGSCVLGLVWRLIGPVGSGTSALNHACLDLGRFVLPSAGTYAVEVATDNDTATGAYSYEIIGAPAERTTADALGQVIGDKTTQIGEWHLYTFTAQAGDAVFLDAQGPCVSGLLWALNGPSGRITIASSCNDLGRFVLPSAGTYAVEVYADGPATGAYTFQVRAGS